MAFVLKTAKTLRTHWKKSTFAAVMLSWGYNYTQTYYQIQDLMRVYCEKAAKYGNEIIPTDAEPRKITIILNPSANKRSSTEDFESYCAPILHLAGINVDVVKTESEGHAKTLINGIDSTDAIVIAGGDGTVSEVITGLLRRTNENTTGLVPLGILPLGKTNSVGQILFPATGKVEKIKAMADAAMAIVEEVVKPIDVLKIEVIDSDDSAKENKAIYAVSGIKWGAYRDAEVNKDSYWFYGSLRKYATYLFNGYKNSLTWRCDANINYTPPCSGCKNCTRVDEQQKKWFQRFAKSTQSNTANIINPECSTCEEKTISTVDFTLNTPIVHLNNNSNNYATPKLLINIGPKSVDYLNFVKEGWRSENGHQRQINETIEARSIVIEPKKNQISGEEKWFSIDNENYELKSVRVTLLPKLINVFCKKSEFLNNTT